MQIRAEISEVEKQKENWECKYNGKKMEKQENGKTCQSDKTNQEKKTKRLKPLEMKQGNNNKSVET